MTEASSRFAAPAVRSWRQDARDGARDIAPVMVAALPIGLLFGAIAKSKGLSALEVTLMSLLVFAGGAQFAAVELWGYPVPVFAIVFSTLLVNARHVLMSASLAPKLVGFSPLQRYFGFFFLTDESWALAERRAVAAAVTPAYWLGAAMLLPAAWVGASFLGALAGPLLGDPQRFGADFAFTALFIGLITSFGRSRVVLATIMASGAAAALVYRVIGPPWHVAAGALAGIAAAYGVASWRERA